MDVSPRMTQPSLLKPSDKSLRGPRRRRQFVESFFRCSQSKFYTVIVTIGLNKNCLDSNFDSREFIGKTGKHSRENILEAEHFRKNTFFLGRALSGENC